MKTINSTDSVIKSDLSITQIDDNTKNWIPFVPGINPEVKNTPLDDISNIVSWVTSFIPGFAASAGSTLLGTAAGGAHIYLNNEVEANATRLKLTISTATFVGCLFLPQNAGGYLIGVGAYLLNNIANAVIDEGKKLYLMNLWQNNFQVEFDNSEQSKILKISAIGTISNSDLAEFINYSGAVKLPENIKVYVDKGIDIDGNRDLSEVIRGADITAIENELENRGFGRDISALSIENYPIAVNTDYNKFIILGKDEKLYFPTAGNDNANKIYLDDEGKYSVDEGWIASGYAGNDTIYGGKNNDTIWGYELGLINSSDFVLNDNDYIYGNGGDDEIYGDIGADYIVGGEGNDSLEGGTGHDTYVFNTGDGIDTINDTNETPLLPIEAASKKGQVQINGFTAYGGIKLEGETDYTDYTNPNVKYSWNGINGSDLTIKYGLKGGNLNALISNNCKINMLEIKY